jgi:uncharacterized protein YggE
MTPLLRGGHTVRNDRDLFREGLWNMMRNHISLVALAILLCVICPAQSQAQFSQGETGAAGVVGSGSTTLDRLPNLMRLQLVITADGKDVKEALGKLKEKQAVVKEKLQKLGAVDSSVSFTDAQAQDANQQQQMERMIQMRNGRVAKPAKNQAPVVTLVTVLKAEWPLAAKTGDELLVESQELQSKVKLAYLGSGKADKPATPEQEEVAEEEQGINDGQGQGNPRGPAFLFVRKISAEEREAARAAAFKKAHDDAARLAKSAGLELGQLRLLASNAASTGMANSNMFGDMDGMGYQGRGRYNMGGDQDSDSEDSSEAIGMQVGKVGYRVTVYTSFGFKGTP